MGHQKSHGSVIYVPVAQLKFAMKEEIAQPWRTSKHQNDETTIKKEEI
jgi:hypothetical protein